MRIRFESIIVLCCILCLLTGCSSDIGTKNKEAADRVFGEDYTPGDLVEDYVEDYEEAGLSTSQYSDVNTTDQAGTETGTLTTDQAGTQAGTLTTDQAGTEAVEPMIIMLDPGHDSTSPGASYGGYKEYIETFRVAQAIKTYLETNYRDVEVYFTRADEKCLSKDIVEDLELRADAARAKGARVLVSLHFNASEDHKQTGATVYISRVKAVTEECRGLATEILKELVALGLKDDGVLTRKSNDHFDENGEALDYYAIPRHAAARGIPAIIVEHCFLDVESDRIYMQNDAAIEALARADAEGIARYYGLKKQ